MPNFNKMARPVSFGGAAKSVEAGRGTPAPFLSPKEQGRRLAALKEADDILAALPEPGQSLHAIMTGRYDLCDCIGSLIGKLGPLKRLTIATLTFHQRNVNALKGWIEAGQVQSLHLLCSLYFKQSTGNPQFENLRSFLATRSGHALAASRCHCKVICFEFVDGAKFALEGSANLRTNSNWEQFQMTRDPDLFEWHDKWIRAEISQHAPKETAAAQAQNQAVKAPAARYAPTGH